MVELLANDLLGELDLALRLVHQREAANRQADAGADAVAIDPDQLQRAATEIAGDAMRLGEPGNHAKSGEISLTTAGDQFDPLADGLLRLGEEGRPIGGLTRGGSRDDADLADLHRLAKNAEAQQRLERTRHRVLGQAAGGGDLPAESRHLLFVEDLGGRARQHLIDDEANRVRTDVDDGDRLAKAQPPRNEAHAGHLSSSWPPAWGGSWGWNWRAIFHVRTGSDWS